MKIILIGNYKPDQQESMIRFAELLKRGFIDSGHTTEIWWPKAFFGLMAKSTYMGMGKWLGYADKWILYPAILRVKAFYLKLTEPEIRFHVCDHSNSPYLKQLPAERTAITCHDVIAIRDGLGYTTESYKISKTGRIYQKWILHHLRNAKLLASVSKKTFDQLKNLNEGAAKQTWKVIYNSYNAAFYPMNVLERDERLKSMGLDPKIPYLLHVGSDLPRKNRALLIEMVNALKADWEGIICYAGDPIDQNLKVLIESKDLQDRVHSVMKPDHENLVALYSGSYAFIFPSLSEGFGWPLIEAQACGAPVIASNIEPMPEISGGAALHADPAEPNDFAKALIQLKDYALRSDLIEKGFRNSERFAPEAMINNYIELYGQK